MMTRRLRTVFGVVVVAIAVVIIVVAVCGDGDNSSGGGKKTVEWALVNADGKGEDDEEVRTCVLLS